MLARNREVNDVAASMKQLEDRFNNRYGYPWVFLNDEPFDEEFIRSAINFYYLLTYSYLFD